MHSRILSKKFRIGDTARNDPVDSLVMYTVYFYSTRYMMVQVKYRYSILEVSKGYAVNGVLRRPRAAEPELPADEEDEEEGEGGQQQPGGSINILGVGPDLPPHQNPR